MARRNHVAAGAAALFSLTSLVATSADAATVRGPYLQDLSSRKVAVLLELDGAHAVSIEVARGVTAMTADAGATPKVVESASHDAVHEVVIDGLEPATSYRYTVKVDGVAGDGGTFTTAPEDDRPFSFLVYGDNRSDDGSHAAIVRALKSAPGDFLVQTGDMVADGAEPADWATFFSIERELLQSRCVFTVIGNHEIGMPTSDGALRFARLFRNGGPSSAGERYYTFRWGDARFFMLDAQDDFASDEREWLQKSLESADAEPGLVYRFVVLHHGPFSSGVHGPNESMRMARVPELLRAHHVDLVVSGHDHIYERGEVSGLRYVISGGGGAPVYTQHRDEPTVARFEAVHHYLAVELTKSSGVVTAIRKDGSTIERCTFSPGGGGGWGCPSENAQAATGNAPAAGNPAPPPRRACDCSFALSRAEWLGAVLSLTLLAVIGLRRKR